MKLDDSEVWAPKNRELLRRLQPTLSFGQESSGDLISVLIKELVAHALRIALAGRDLVGAHEQSRSFILVALAVRRRGYLQRDLVLDQAGCRA